jgi:hypothetical protein
VAVGNARYSVEYVGKTVSVWESATHHEIFQPNRCIARQPQPPPAAGGDVE